MTLSNGYIASSFVWPATNYTNQSTLTPYGTRFRLKSSFNISTFSPCAQVVLTALKNYGVILSDGGYNWQINIEYDAWPVDAMNALQEITYANIANTNWEAIDESSLEISPTSGEANVNRETVCYNSSSGSNCTDVVLQGVAVNLPQNILYIMGGTPTQQLTAMVHDGQNNAVTWSMNPGLGTLSSSGAYTAPSILTVPMSTVITATSVVNPAVSASMTIWAFPPTGFRGLPATTTDYTDSSGNLWKSGVGYGLSANPQLLGCCQTDGSFPTSVPNYQLYQNHYYSSVTAGDLNTSFLMPAGTYDITYYADSIFPAGQMAFTFISQGNILASGIDPALLAGGQNKPYTFTTTQTVGPDNHLSFYIWGSGGVPNSGGDMTALSVVPH
jgi:hypothetical protein